MTHLITNLKSKDFMGHSIDEPIGQKTIFTGKNTVGKSTRANIIAITALGFSPFSSKTNKKPSDILNDFGNGQKMVTEFTCGGVIFERKFTRSKKGSVSNITRVNKTKADKAEFAVALSNAGNPQIIDLNAFLKISDNEKINTLFKLYPPGVDLTNLDSDLTNLDSDIEKSKKKISKLNDSIGNNEGAIKKLIESKTAIEMPAGTLADTTAAIATLTKGVLEAQNALKIAEKKNTEDALADQKAKTDREYEEKVKELAQEEPKSTQAQADQIMEENTKSFPHEKENAVENENRQYEHNVNSNQVSGIRPEPLWAAKTIRESIQKIIATMAKTDCSMCASLLVAKIELKKFK